MKKLTMLFAFLIAVTLVLGMGAQAVAMELKIAIMQDQPGDAEKYKPLLDYLETKGISARFVTAKNYPVAARMFASGSIDAMFSGSGVAGSMIIKDVAKPLVRPLTNDNTSTYWAVVLAPKGAKKFSGSGDYFKGKRVIFCSLASSGEFFYRSVDGALASGAGQLKAASHGAAIDALSKGQADVAIVKNRVWDGSRSKYPDLDQVGEDRGENPDNTLIVASTMTSADAKVLEDALLSVGSDSSAKAREVKEALKIKGFIKTTEDDFKHTISLLKSAGVDKSFEFSF